jgi:Domain of unknown function (DUF4331)
MKRRRLARVIPAVGLAAGLALSASTVANASSHREAPAISEDPVADLTDVYAFVSPDNAAATTLVMNVNPFELAAGGPNFHRFGDDVLYEFNIDNDGDAVANIKYQFRFKTTYSNPNTFLYNTNQVTSLNDPDLNVRQMYTVTEVKDGVSKEIGTGLTVAPANVGPRSMPNYRALADAAVAPLEGSTMKVFAGPRDDPFFADLGSIFDLGGLRPFNKAHLIPLKTARGRDYLAGFNVHSIVLQVPSSRITKSDPVIGMWATTSRRVPGAAGAADTWKQVARLGQPLVNEVVVPVGAKDLFNSSSPDKDAQFLKGVLDPELGRLIPVLYPGVKVPTEVKAGLGLGGREDLATIFLTGIPGLNQPKGVKPSEQLRVNTSIAKSAYPNGRTLNDDIVDTSFQVVAGATAFSKEFNVFPNNVLGDGVNFNDREFMNRFPYVGWPSDGYSSYRLNGDGRQYDDSTQVDENLDSKG